MFMHVDVEKGVNVYWKKFQSCVSECGQYKAVKLLNVCRMSDRRWAEAAVYLLFTSRLGSSVKQKKKRERKQGYCNKKMSNSFFLNNNELFLIWCYVENRSLTSFLRKRLLVPALPYCKFDASVHVYKRNIHLSNLILVLVLFMCFSSFRQDLKDKYELQWRVCCSISSPPGL